MRRLCFTFVAFALGCGGSPTDPGPNPNPQPTTVTISGRVLTTLTNEPVAGATLNFSGRTVTSGSDGRWSLDAQNKNATLPVEVSAAGYLARQTAVRTAEGRTDITIDLIQDAAPFNLGFYRQTFRNDFDAPGSLQQIRRWTQNPSVYVDTRKPSGGTLTTEEVEAIRAGSVYAIESASGGALNLDRFESGAEARTPTSGWIQVSVITDPANQFCGTGQVGTNPGAITLNYDRCVRECSTLGIRPSTIRHEFAHAMGLWHNNTQGLMGAGQATSCANPARFSDAELHHARIAYSRPVGNLDIDRDGSGTALLNGLSAAPVVYCRH